MLMRFKVESGKLLASLVLDGEENGWNEANDTLTVGGFLEILEWLEKENLLEV